MIYCHCRQSLELVAVGLYVPRVLRLPLLGYLVRAVQQHLGVGVE